MSRRTRILAVTGALLPGAVVVLGLLLGGKAFAEGSPSVSTVPGATVEAVLIASSGSTGSFAVTGWDTSGPGGTTASASPSSSGGTAAAGPIAQPLSGGGSGFAGQIGSDARVAAPVAVGVAGIGVGWRFLAKLVAR